MAAPSPLLATTGLGKIYTVPVLADFDFQLRPGEVHALVGANGAGKSTFARIVAGLVRPDAGRMQLAGQPYAPRTKREAEQAGVVMVLQELNLLPTLTVAENLMLDRMPHRAGFIRYPVLHARARAALERVGLADVPPDIPAGRLGVGQQQLVEIARALAQNCRLLLLDEPTAALTDPEIARLFENIRRLQRAGVGILYISHRMDEIRRIADRVTVLRDGRRVAEYRAADTTPAQLVRDMVGHELPERPPAPPRAAGAVALRVRGLQAGERVRDVSFAVRQGEILGLAGLIGAGRTETLRAIFGADARDGGAIYLGEPPSPLPVREPADAVRAGIGFVPEDRQQQALLLPQSVRVNVTLATLPRHAGRWGWLDAESERAAAERDCRGLDVRCTSVEQPVQELSGGNQQKVVMARWLARDCSVLLFDEPTRGIDVAAKETIYALLRRLAAEGRAVVVVSSELNELMALCHRIAVMSAGRIVAEFRPDEWSHEQLTRAAFQGHLDAPASTPEGCDA